MKLLIIIFIIKFNNYNVLIDACAFLKDYDNKYIAEILYKYNLERKGVRKTIIYLLKDKSELN